MRSRAAVSPRGGSRPGTPKLTQLSESRDPPCVQSLAPTPRTKNDMDRAPCGDGGGRRGRAGLSEGGDRAQSPRTAIRMRTKWRMAVPT
jgi:hypothetical protein